MKTKIQSHSSQSGSKTDDTKKNSEKNVFLSSSGSDTNSKEKRK